MSQDNYTFSFRLSILSSSLFRFVCGLFKLRRHFLFRQVASQHIQFDEQDRYH